MRQKEFNLTYIFIHEAVLSVAIVVDISPRLSLRRRSVVRKYTTRRMGEGNGDLVNHTAGVRLAKLGQPNPFLSCHEHGHGVEAVLHSL